MRHPNGYGTVAKLSGVRRNPYVARKTKSWDDRGYPVYETIGYYPTREAGLIALAQYNKDPWNIRQEKITLEELYDLWLEKKAPKLGQSNRASLKSVFKRCAPLFNVSYKDLRAHQMQMIIDANECSYSRQNTLKNLFRHLDGFALELDIVTRCYSGLLTSAPAPETTKLPFTAAEIAALWAAQSEPWVDSALVFLYSGFRISELLDIKTADVDLTAGTIKGGTKTKAGKNRIVPIHPRIAPLIAARLAQGGEYLFEHDAQKVTPYRYYTFWRAIMKRIPAAHTVHETRHTFRSRLDSAGANKRCIDLIMGHKSKDVGERVYTHKTIQELRTAIELITQ
ncbi:MAG: tyrosine-type recombinase/integrase [Oscillospiraceae bacterium]|jgi:integrase|nr:tyrosine-type recombinase/integrase [Oscillospiraceae bacterium]